MNDEHDSGDAAAEAFEQVLGELALLRQAVENLAAEQADTPDYAPTLGAISHNQMVAAQRLDALSKSPALSLTPAAIGSQIERAAADMRAGERQTLDGVRREFEAATKAMTGKIASARERDQQFYWVLGAAFGGVVAGMLMWIAITGPIARELPASWQVAERFAANTMGMSKWEAGAKLMAADDPDRWHAVVADEQMILDNREALKACRNAAATAEKAVPCILKIEAE